MLMRPSPVETTPDRVCPVCGGSAYAEFLDEHIDPSKLSDYSYSSRKQPEFMCLRLVRCLDCDLVYAPAPPNDEFLSSAYATAAYDSVEEATRAAASYAEALDPFLTLLPHRGAAVDVGAGSGPFLSHLIQRDFKPVIGVEPSKAAISAAQDSVRSHLREGMFSASLLSDVTPTLICSFMTLEHVADPGEFVRCAFDILEPGGMLAVVVHDWRAPLNRFLGKRSPIVDIEHLQLFSPKSAETLFSQHGFSGICQREIANTYPIRYWLRLTPFPSSVKNKLARAMASIGLLGKNMSIRVGNRLIIGFKNN